MKIQELLKNIQSSHETIANVVSASGRYKNKLKLSFLCTFFSALFLGISLTQFYFIFDQIQIKNTSGLINSLIIFSILAILSLIFRFFSLSYDMNGNSVNAGTDMRLKLGEHLRRIPLEKLNQKRSGELNALFLGHVEEAISFTSAIATLVIFAITVPIVVMIITFFIDWRLGLLLLAIFPFSFALYMWRRPAFNRGFTYLAKVTQQMNAELVELIQGLSVIKSTNTVSENLSKYQKLCQDVQKVQYIGQKKGGRPNLIMNSTTELGLFLVIALGTVWTITGSLGSTVVTAIMVMFVRFNEMFSMLVLYAAAMEILSIGYKNILELLNIEPQTQPEKILKEPENYTITFNNVSFHYENSEQNLFDNISLQFPEKSMTALVGGSGCGKSTLIKLIMRFSDVQKGSINIGGVNIKDMPNEYLMKLITIVFQDIYLFNDTIFNNIKMGNSDVSDEEVYLAAKRAQCDIFVSKLSKGYQTIVNDNGNNFSGGEKQRISIARALLKNAPIIILDEPTAALDIENELAVQNAIEELVKNKTLIVISHRLSTIKNADHIIVLENGKIIEQGKHQELLHNQNLYAHFWNLQQSIDLIQLN